LRTLKLSEEKQAPEVWRRKGAEKGKKPFSFKEVHHFFDVVN
jgi:hypothetical protein